VKEILNKQSSAAMATKKKRFTVRRFYIQLRQLVEHGWPGN